MDGVLAKLVICVSAVVAVATSRALPWVVEDEQLLRVALDVRSQQQLILSVELGGELYADTFGEGVALTATANRGAADFKLSARSLTRSSAPDPLDSAASAEAPSTSRSR
jgi:hypothetical protein